MTLIRALPFDPRDRGDIERTVLPHVLLVVDEFSKTFGGGERIALKLAALLPRYGYRVSILTFSVHPECAGLKSPPCAIYVLPLQRTYGFNALRAAVALKRFLKQEQIRIVQTFFESSDLWAGLVAKMTSTAKLIWSRRDMGILRDRKHHIAYRLMSGIPDVVFAVSEQVHQHCVSVDRVASNRVLTIYNGLDVADWEMTKRGGGSGKLLVATLGNIRRVKGHDVFIEAAASVIEKFPNVSFTIAGEVLDQDYFRELQDLVRKLKLTDHFTFVSGVTNIREYLSAADVFVLPSRSEGFSNAIIEAMAASLPVVATDVGGNAEAVRNDVSGFIVPSEDIPALSGAILRLLTDPSKAMAMGAAGRELVVKKFTLDAMMNQITDVYASLLEARTLPNPTLQ